MTKKRTIMVDETHNTENVEGWDNTRTGDEIR
jgi:hypothetical protein